MQIHSPNQNVLRRYVRSSLFAALLLGLAAPIGANQGTPPPSLQQKVLPVAVIQQVALPPTDVNAELAADAKAGKPLPLRFAVAVSVELTPATSGTWEQLPDGRLWRLRIVSTNATDLNFGFTTFWLPKGAMLWITSETESHSEGPYTAEYNQDYRQLWTPVVPGEAAIIELFVPADVQKEPELVLGQVNAGYRDLFHVKDGTGLAKAGSCEIDTTCAQGVPWANEIRSVCRISIGGSALCTATLIMDAPGDFRAFLLTANHCGITAGNAATVVAYWNFQATCGSHGIGGSTAQNQTGSTFRAAKADVDFSLIELTSLPSSTYNVYYAGWDRSGAAPGGGVGIHHPNGDAKCISFSISPFSTIDDCVFSGVSTHWQVPWQNPTQGVTEQGSSGSGIWDSTTRFLVGTLTGGPSSCTATPANLWDCYGKFSLAWASGSSSADRLRDWLDPQNTGLMNKPGADPRGLVATVIPTGATLVAEGCTPTNGVVDPGEVVTVSFALQNTGTAPTTNLVATLLVTNGVIAPSGPQSYGALAAGGAAVARSFMFMATGACGGTILPTLQLQDGPRNLGTAAFSMTLGVPTSSVFLSQNFDGVTAPALPVGWTSSTSGGSLWATTTAQRDTLPNSAFVADPSAISDNLLVSPSIFISSANSQLTFRHYYITESGYDGCALEISINGGSFTDILSAGGTFVNGGYTTTISTCCGNPLAGRQGWSGNSSGFVTTVVTLPAAATGQNIQLRWRLGSDSSLAGTGWYVDTVSVSQIGYLCCVGAPSPRLTGARFNASHQFQLTVTGGTGYTYAVLGSTNVRTPLSNWVSLTTNTSPFTFIESNAPAFPRRFYRAQSK
jgi:hypothetical protein